ncbi:MAG: DUF4405 domain-containing protein [Promethearchaeota archaeon]|jgi:hypothetical protein
MSYQIERVLSFLQGDLYDKNLGVTRELRASRTRQEKKFTKFFVILGMIITSSLLFFTGIIKFLNIWLNIRDLGYIAAFLTNLHDWSGIILAVFVGAHLILHWKWMLTMTKKLFKSSRLKRKKINYIIDITMVILGIIVFVTGIIKFPTLQLIVGYFYTVSEAILILHDWGSLILIILALTHLVLHWKWIVGMAKKMIRKDRMKIFIQIGGITALLLMILIPTQLSVFSQTHPGDEIHIAGFGTFKFNPEEIDTARPELFRNGHYSLFDILVDLDNRGEIEMDFYYNNELDTHVISSINGIEYWWYSAYYDGGWQEANVFRMDHYPYKPKMYIRLFRTISVKLQSIYSTFREEVQRLENNNRTIIIPVVGILGPSNGLRFLNVEVTAHNLRNDTFQNGVITAIDVIMSLGDAGLLTYKLNWYDTIGVAEVKNYYIDGINKDIANGKCGFVYEAGDSTYKGFLGNHIHIPSDYRIIVSPEYEEWFWICL